MEPATSARLAHFVRRITMVAPEHTQPTYSRLPHGEAELLVRCSEVGARAVVIGPLTHTLRKDAGGLESTLLVRFHIGGAYPFFARPMPELTDGVVSLGELWNRRAAETIASTRDPGSTVRAVV